MVVSVKVVREEVVSVVVVSVQFRGNYCRGGECALLILSFDLLIYLGLQRSTQSSET